MSDKLVILCTSKDGVTLNTKGTYCDKDIHVIPQVEGVDSALPIEVATEEEMNALLSTAEVGSIFIYTGESGTFENGALYLVEEGE